MERCWNDCTQKCRGGGIRVLRTHFPFLYVSYIFHFEGQVKSFHLKAGVSLMFALFSRWGPGLIWCLLGNIGIGGLNLQLYPQFGQFRYTCSMNGTRKHWRWGEGVSYTRTIIINLKNRMKTENYGISVKVWHFCVFIKTLCIVFKFFMEMSWNSFAEASYHFFKAKTTYFYACRRFLTVMTK